MSKFEASILAKLDTSKIPSQLKGIGDTPITFKNIKLDLSGLSAQIQKQFGSQEVSIKVGNIDVGNATSKMQQSGSQAASAFVKGFNSGVTIIKNNSIPTIQHLQDLMAKAHFNTDSINAATKDLQKMNVEVSHISTNINNNKMRLNISGIDELGRSVTIIKELDNKSGTIKNVATSLGQGFATSADEAKKFSQEVANAYSQLISKSKEIGTISSRLKVLDGKKNSNEINELKSQLEALKTEYNELYSVFERHFDAKQIEGLNEAISKSNDKIALFSAKAEDAKKSISSLDTVTLENKMSTWLSKNSKAVKDYGARIEDLKRKLKSLGTDDIEGFQKIQNEFKKIQQDAINTGKVGRSFGGTLKNAFEKVIPFVSTADIFRKAVDVLKEMYQEVQAVDTAMTNLYKVTDETDARYERFLQNSATSAKELGKTVSSLIEQSATWAKLGYSLDQSEELAKISSMYANVGEVDDNTAVSDLVTAMKAFNIEAKDAIAIVDPLNELGK